MKINNVREYIRKNLNDKYVKDKNKEWVYIDIINNRIDIEIVSNSISNFSDEKNYLTNLINELNKDMENGIELYLGHVNINTVDEAEFLQLQKPNERILNNLSFGELIKAGENNISNIKELGLNTSKIISFYSYKGGVGRTIALIQTAYILAKEGKNVLLLDLDIEAPSFYNIFKDDLKVEYGLVDYLYEDLYFKNKKEENNIKINYIISKLNLNLKGEIYIIPAGKINKNYVSKLEMLKEKRIYENKSIQKVIRESENRYNIDYTLVDSRTGINNWGALSLIDISDEVMLFAYPNRENIEGIKLIMELIEPYKTPTIVLSRIHNSKEGKNIAQDLFDELDNSQEFIPIYYDSSIALAQKYPIKNTTEPFEGIAKFILQKEYDIKYKKIIKENNELVRDIINQLNNTTEYNTILNTNEEKIVNCNNWIVINSNNIDINEYVINLIYKIEENTDIIIAKANNENEYKIEFKSIVANILNTFYKMAIEKAKKNNIRIHREFNNYNIEKFKLYIEKTDNINMIQSIKDFKQKIFREEFIKNTVYIINFKDLYSFSDKEDISTNSIIIKAILLILDILSEDNINFKLLITQDEYNNYIEEFNKYNSNILNLVWDKNESSLQKIKQILQGTINLLNDKTKKEIYNKLNIQFNSNIGYKNLELIEKYNDIILSIGESKSKKPNLKDSQIHKQINELMDGITFSETSFNNSQEESILDFIFCKSINSSKYSKSLIKWIYENLYKEDKLDKKHVIELVKNAVDIERKADIQNKNSIITFESFEGAMKKIINKK